MTSKSPRSWILSRRSARWTVRALALLGALSLSLAGARAGQAAQAPAKSCADAIPKDCAKAKHLGEEKGCDCYVCNPDTKQRKVVCVKDEADKRALKKIVEESGEGAGAAPKGPR